ncbi:GAF domain-containing sensor histidine kinase [Salinarimonas soli]|uniref:histidine kinase n=1 Tax=Salinarimonas soli TaxID=1638099 RepID=A0A5B2VBZ8_9HYPH|nr:GAF domain-containing sensor histidine kinase [Salinarimonas soli]KAA2235990.1 GAF domain-containing sensor histidine kinase [Salinarimonas soli]
MKAPLAANEEQRLAALRRYGILDTPEEAVFDNITRLAAHICDAPIAVINLIDERRQWFKAEVGLGVRETPLDVSICAHAILQSGLVVVPDATRDARFACNPLVTGGPRLRFYAGAILETSDGYPLGTLCVLDDKVSRLSPEQGEALMALAHQTMALFELRRNLAEVERVSVDRARLMAVAGHDLKQPLQTISLALEVAQPKVLNKLHAALVRTALNACDKLGSDLDQLVQTARLGGGAPRWQRVALQPFIAEVVAEWEPHLQLKAMRLKLAPTSLCGFTDPAMLASIMRNLIGNGIKYTLSGGRILVGCRRRGSAVLIEVWDTGIGIAPGKLERVFDAFHQLNPEESDGLGMGLAIVRQTATMLGHEVSVKSVVGRGTVFRVSVPIVAPSHALSPPH